jgi:hypothetical protein
MNQAEQNDWLTKHIPHRVRAAIARLDVQNTLLNLQALIDPDLQTIDERIWWRCSTDSIWEGRLAAVRWLIEFVGIQQDRNGQPKRRKKQKNDVGIDDIAGGVEITPATADAKFLADVWKGCSQASSHATNAYNHPAIGDHLTLPKAMTIILDHLQLTIYRSAGKNIKDYVLTLA